MVSCAAPVAASIGGRSVLRNAARPRSWSFDLDIVNQFLAKRLGRDEPVKVKLTGTYRTFIRNRAEV
jgi:predicted 2-oxoglutarate/Fe(II)-dependent dioxygenase YbiX